MIKLTKAQAEALDDLVRAFELAKDALRDKLDEIATGWEDEIGNKPERWQEGEEGQASQERVDLVRGWIDEIPGEGEARGWRVARGPVVRS